MAFSLQKSIEETSITASTGKHFLQALMLERANGVLKLQQSDIVKTLTFSQGMLIDATSTLPTEQLLSISKQANALPPNFPLTNQPLTTKEVLDLLQQQGVAIATIAALQHQQRSIIAASICAWSQGTYQWQPQQANSASIKNAISPLTIAATYIKKTLRPQELIQRYQPIDAIIISIVQPLWQQLQSFIAATPITQAFASLLGEHPLSLSAMFKTLNLAVSDNSTQAKYLLGLEALQYIACINLTTQAKKTSSISPGMLQTTTEDDLALLQKLATMREQDYFTILGLPRHASGSDIRKAYFQLAKQYHPDKFFNHTTKQTNRAAEELFALIHSAYDTLHDEKKRTTYLTYLEQGISETTAVAQAQQALQSEVDFQKGLSLLRSRNFKEALTLFEQAVVGTPDEPEYVVYALWATFLQPSTAATEKKQLAQKLFNLLTQTKKPIPEGWFFLGRIYKLLGQDQEALSAYQKVLALNPSHKDANAELRRLKTQMAESQMQNQRGLGKLFKRS